jgi:hypothetical protein
MRQGRSLRLALTQNMNGELMGKSYSVTVGGKKYSIKLPSFLSGDKKTSKKAVPVNIKHAVKAKKDRYNELDRIDKELSNVGKSEMEKEVFGDDYTN